MAVWARIKSLSFKEVFQLSKVCILHPRFIIPTLKATRETVKICDQHFQNDHHKNNRTNAFRHALWNYLISKKCFQVCGSVGKSVDWSKIITDLHEKLAPNAKLLKLMDLHNNKVGRNLFQKFYSEENFDFIAILKEEMRAAVKVSSTEEINNLPEKMVYTEDR